MAYEIEPHTEVNVDTPLTNFPVSEDSWDRMSDVNSVTYPLVKQYETFVNAGDFSSALTLVSQYPELKSCLFNAWRENSGKDAITAIERYLLNDVTNLYNEIAQNAVGINDDPTSEQADLVAYSAKHVEERLQDQANKYHATRNVTLLASNWSTTYPYMQTVSVPGVLSTMDIKVVGLVRSNTNSYIQDKALKKAAGFLIDNDNGVGNGTITFYALKRPEIDFTVVTEGG